MANAVIEHTTGELVGEGHRHDVRLKLTVKELYSNESPRPVARAIERIELASKGVQDGSYTLRYAFDGKQEQTGVRVQHGMLLSAG